MENLRIGVGELAVRIRHSRSLKDKRQVTQSLVQKLRNLGFSASVIGTGGDRKMGNIGYAYVGGGVRGIRKMLDEVKCLTAGSFEVLHHHQDIVDFEPGFEWEENELLNRKEGEDEE